MFHRRIFRPLVPPSFTPKNKVTSSASDLVAVHFKVAPSQCLAVQLSTYEIINEPPKYIFIVITE